MVKQERTPRRFPKVMPTPERMAKGGLRLADGKYSGDVWTLDRAHNKGLITEEQYSAGERLYSLWYYAGLSPSVTMRWGNDVVIRNADYSERQAFCRHEYFSAVAALPRVAQEMLFNLLIENHTIQWWEQRWQYREGFGKYRLREALDDLYRYFKQKKML